MAVRSAAGGPLNEGIVVTLNIPTACKGDTAKGDIVDLACAAGGSDWQLGSTTAHQTLLQCGIVREVNSASTLAAVELFHYHNAIRLNTSTGGGGANLGSQVYMGNTDNIHQVVTSAIAGKENYVAESGSADCVVLFH